jgi:prepilin-type N-terminal cleavage/methylation domain-containing protein
MNSRGMCRSRLAGYSLVEMVMTLAIGLILAAITLPTLIGAIQGYRLSSAAQQAAGLIDLARYTAIRRNTFISLKKTTQNGNTVLFVDLKGSGNIDPADPMTLLPTDMQIANGQSLTPAPTSMGIGSTQDFVDTITFDYRGTVNFGGGGPTSSYFLALGFTNQVQYGYRAVTTSPMGQTKLWKSVAGSSWTGM